MSANPCPVCEASPKSQVLCHRIGDYICESHCTSCEYLNPRVWHCSWQGGPERMQYSVIEMDKILKKLRALPMIGVEKYSAATYYNAAFQKIVEILVENKEPRDKLPYYWTRLEAAHRVLHGGNTNEAKEGQSNL